MAERLRPDGGPVRVGGVVVVSPGLTGVVEVHRPGQPGLRAAEDTRPELLDALARCGYEEQLTVALGDTAEAPAPGVATRSTPGGEPAITVEVPGPGSGFGQLVLAVDEGGAASWHFAEERFPDEGGQIGTRGGDSRTYTIPRRVPEPEEGPGARGLIGAIGSKLLKVLVFPLVDPVLGKVGDFFARRWEQRNRAVRLRAFTPADHRLPEPAAAAPGWDALAGGPALLFLHGTASLSHSGFHCMPPETLAALHERYRGRVLAYDHHTLSVDPAENARALVELVPPGAGLVVDVVAHSRGGLVGRALCELPGEIGLTPDRLRVRTLVMGGTPNAGTALADPAHLGSWLDRMTNFLQLVPDNPVTDTLDVVLTVAKQVALGAFKGLDGVVSMAPGGPFLAERLNRPSDHTAAYRALAADYEPPEGSALAHSLRDGVMDAVFGATRNDLVVPTDGVHGANGATGFPVAEAEVFAADHGVDHNNYWAAPRTQAALARWLTG